MKNINKIFFIALLIATQFMCGPVLAKTSPKRKYVKMEFVSGQNSAYSLYLDSRDQIINFQEQQPSSIRLRMNANVFYPTKKLFPASFRVEAYELDSEGNKKFLSTVRPTVYNRKYAKGLVFDMGVGVFTTDFKNVFVDVYDNDGELYNTYKYQIQARNISSQTSMTETPLTPADCPSGPYDDCLLKYVFKNVEFEALPKRNIRTEVKKLHDGKYLVSIPIARRKVQVQRGSFAKNEDLNLADNNGNVYESRLNVGVSDTLKAVLNYDPVKKDFGISFGTSEIDKLTFTENGHLGIGVENPLGFLHVAGGSASTPSLVLEPGTLVTSPKNGAIEYDGSNIYLTTGGVRGKIISTSDVNGKVTATEVNDDFVLLNKVQTVTNKTFDSAVLTGNTVAQDTATFSNSLIINDGTQADGYVLVSDSAGRAGWENFSSAINNANVSMDMLSDIISDKQNGNIMVGNGSGIALNGGKFNTALGVDSSRAQITGNGNIAIGFQAGDNLTSGSNNITIGYDTDVVNQTGSNQLNIGNTIFGDINLKRVGIGALSPQTRFQIGDGTADFISGPDSLYVKDDIEADGNIYANSLSVTNSLSAGGLITGNDLSISNDATFSKFTQGSVPFFGAGGALSEANSSLFYDSTNARVGIGTNTPASKLDVNGTIRIRGGTPAENFVLTATNTDGDST